MKMTEPLTGRHAQLAVKIANHVTNITTTLCNPPDKREVGCRNIVKLGSHLPVRGVEIKDSYESGMVNLEGYLYLMSEVFEELEKVVSYNHQNYYNHRLVLHMKKIVNTLLETSKVMEVVNACVDHLPGYDDDPETA